MNIQSLAGFISEWLGVIAVAWMMGIAARFQKPVTGFKYARRDGFAALGIAAVLLVFAFAYQFFNPPTFPDPAPIAPGPIADLGKALVLAGLGLLPVLAALYTRKQPIRSAGWNQPLIVPGLLMGLAIALLTIFLRNRHYDLLLGLDSTELTQLFLAIGIALAEETIFRGYIQLRLVWWLGLWRGILLTSVLYTGWHLAAWVGRLPADTIVVLVLLTFIQSLVVGWVARRSGGVAAGALYRAISIWATVFP